MYHFLYNTVFCLSFINFLNYWINLFFTSKPSQNLNISQLEHSRFNSTFNLALSQASKNGQGGVNSPKTEEEFYNSEIIPYGGKLGENYASFNNLTVPFTVKDTVFPNLSFFSIKSLVKFKSFSFIIGSILWLFVTLLLFSRIIQSNHFPLANFYEALIFLTWCLVTVNFILLLQPTSSSSLGTNNSEVQKQVSGAILAPCILFIIAFAQFHLSSSITPLVPALKSNWLLMHVSIMICSYTTFLVGGLLSILLLIQTIFSGKNFAEPDYKIISSNNEEQSYNQKDGKGYPSFEYVMEGPSKMQKKNFFIVLDNLSYRMMGIGFPLFTLGILSGAVWANEAWGSYWSWDIKEVGSLINWLIVALYFHCRYKNFIKLSHLVAFISLTVLFFNFFGISLGIFGSSLHAYGAAS